MAVGDIRAVYKEAEFEKLSLEVYYNNSTTFIIHSMYFVTVATGVIIIANSNYVVNCCLLGEIHIKDREPIKVFTLLWVSFKQEEIKGDKAKCPKISM